MMTFGTKGRQHGIALVLVLWMTTLLTVIGASFVFSMRTDTLLAQNMVASAKAQALADAGLQRAFYELFKTANDKQRWKADGVQHTWDYSDAKIKVSIQDVSGKIDLNTASDGLLKGLFKSVGVPEDQSVALSDAILDWRDADELKRLNGAEAPEYQAAGLKYKPANAPFEIVEELQRVLGVTPQIYAGVADAVTVDSRQSGINAAIASRKVLMALPGVDEAAVDIYIALREQALADDLPPPPFPQAGIMAAGNSSVYSVRAEAVLPDGAAFIREAVVKTNRGATRKIVYLSWKDGEAASKSSLEKTPVIDGK